MNIQTIRVYRGEEYGSDWIPDGLADAIEWLQDKMEEIPEEYRATASLSIDSETSYYDSSKAAIEIYYQRPETPEEVQQRAATVKWEAERVERQEKEHLARLLHKYGPKPWVAA